MSNISKRAAVILAAGKSTRMKSAKSKVLHEVGGMTLLEWVTRQARSINAEKIIAVVNEQNDDVRREAERLGLEIAVQETLDGTASAVLASKENLKNFDGQVIVLCGDAPLLQQNTLENVFDRLDKVDGVVVLGFEPENPGNYGRLIVKDGALEKIVEAREASPEQLDVRLCNSGLLAARRDTLFEALAKVDNENAKGEYYLTDVVEIALSMGKNCTTFAAPANEVIGVDSRELLARAEQAFQTRMRTQMMDAGVTLRDPDTTYFSWDTEIEAEAEIGANVVFGPGSSVSTGAVIHPFCHIEGANIGKDAQIGPFARLRPGAHMGEKSKAGNFVEVKKSFIGKGSKINHLSYIGDAEIGEGVNVGAGTITCNYDGYSKHKTIIGDGAFIGTNSSLVAPLSIGAGAYLGSGAVITKNVPDDALALSRTKQVNKEGWAKRYRAAQEKRKAKREKS